MTHPLPKLVDALIKCAKGIDEVVAAIGTDLHRDNEGYIIDDSDLGIAVRELDHVSTTLSRIIFHMPN
jgi:hypothetical protein